MAAATAASASEAAAPKTKPVCEHEGGRLVLERPAGTEDDAALTQQLSQRLHEALTEWSGGSLTGCRAEVVWKGASHCGTVFELPGAYHFHGHGAHLTLTSECAGTAPSSKSTTTNVEAGAGSSGSKARIVYLHSAHNVYLFHFTGGASIHARGIGFQGGTGKWGGAIELSGEGIDSDSDFTGCLFDSDQALSSGGAVVVEGAIDPDTAEPTTARFHDCSFTRARTTRDSRILCNTTNRPSLPMYTTTPPHNRQRGSAGRRALRRAHQARPSPRRAGRVGVDAVMVP